MGIWGVRVSGTYPKMCEAGRTRRVNQAVGDLVPPVLLPASRPHDGFSGEWRGRRIPSLPMERPSHLRVRSEARWDTGVCVGLWWSRRVVGHVRRRPAHVRHGVRGGDKGGRAGARPPLTLLQLHIKPHNLVANIAH